MTMARPISFTATATATVCTGSNRRVRRRDRTWVKHVIDESFSQIHALKLVDIDGDGEPELLTGKRYRGHNGNDPGSYDPLVIYYYKIDRKTASSRAIPFPSMAPPEPARNSSSKIWMETATWILRQQVKQAFTSSRI